MRFHVWRIPPCPALSRRELLSLQYGGRNGPTVRTRQHFRSIAARAAPTARPFRPPCRPVTRLREPQNDIARTNIAPNASETHRRISLSPKYGDRKGPTVRARRRFTNVTAHCANSRQAPARNRSGM
ncbi:hypothetical protein GCM10011574_04170 [Microbispora bryophytorum]|uniref:Uncharacterized protein n=1 Tax=Microbispora bryophytorum TaxID=1460882 RepID=A0A8H9LB31_9ACTN|nr:hypothetical protein GCM10011574_04170 [Microbispora bryophytorum]